MKFKLTFGLLALSSLAIAPIYSYSQDTAASSQDKSADVRTITGCLSAGEKAGEYNLVANDGSTWEVRSKTVKLAGHVGHTVTVTGKVWHPDMHGAKEKTKDAVDPNAKEHGHLGATDVSMVSDSCKK
ncbi:MAG TPA: hypothetical protein VK525_21690 [Candidatus Saccharimonadales bacterium]|nr:hypothetical protein [Candidatus Saccharimonadales bacterium]